MANMFKFKLNLLVLDAYHDCIVMRYDWLRADEIQRAMGNGFQGRRSNQAWRVSE